MVAIVASKLKIQSFQTAQIAGQPGMRQGKLLRRYLLTAYSGRCCKRQKLQNTRHVAPVAFTHGQYFQTALKWRQGSQGCAQHLLVTAMQEAAIVKQLFAQQPD